MSYTSKTLKKVPVTIRDLNVCKKKYEKTNMVLTDAHICVFDEKPVAGMCAVSKKQFKNFTIILVYDL